MRYANKEMIDEKEISCYAEQFQSKFVTIVL